MKARFSMERHKVRRDTLLDNHFGELAAALVSRNAGNVLRRHTLCITKMSELQAPFLLCVFFSAYVGSKRAETISK